MIGNDVVDLQLAKKQSNWERKGFLEKVFTTSERLIIGISEDPNLQVWLLWSMKEAAYKAHQRLFKLPRRLNWQEQQCEISSFEKEIASGVVRIGTEAYFTRSTISEESVFSSAVYQKGIHVKNKILKGSSNEMKLSFLKVFSKLYMLDQNDLKIVKNQAGIPLILYKNQYFNTCFSFTAHGSFSAFSFPLTNC